MNVKSYEEPRPYQHPIKINKKPSRTDSEIKDLGLKTDGFFISDD
jgi:hypothetical protein